MENFSPHWGRRVGSQRQSGGGGAEKEENLAIGASMLPATLWQALAGWPPRFVRMGDYPALTFLCDSASAVFFCYRAEG
jgi:hypothetical protein